MPMTTAQRLRRIGIGLAAAFLLAAAPTAIAYPPDTGCDGASNPPLPGCKMPDQSTQPVTERPGGSIGESQFGNAGVTPAVRPAEPAAARPAIAQPGPNPAR